MLLYVCLSIHGVSNFSINFLPQSTIHFSVPLESQSSCTGTQGRRLGDRGRSGPGEAWPWEAWSRGVGPGGVAQAWLWGGVAVGGFTVVKEEWCFLIPSVTAEGLCSRLANVMRKLEGKTEPVFFN